MFLVNNQSMQLGIFKFGDAKFSSKSRLTDNERIPLILMHLDIDKTVDRRAVLASHPISRRTIRLVDAIVHRRPIGEKRAKFGGGGGDELVRRAPSRPVSSNKRGATLSKA